MSCAIASPTGADHVHGPIGPPFMSSFESVASTAALSGRS